MPPEPAPPDRHHHEPVRDDTLRAVTGSEGGIRLWGVSKAFGSTHALDAVDLDVAPGELVTLLGPSGCGKTTLLRIVGGLESASDGVVTVDGDQPATARSHKRIGFVPQSPALFPWRTVEANARLLQDVNRKANGASMPDPVELLDHVGLGDFRRAYPHELSGGMQQRVALVRAFALGAPYLLMDEPFAALDEITRTDMRHLLAELCEPLNTTVVFVTHSLAESVYLSDRVVVLSARPGRIVGIEEITLPHPRTPDLEDDPAFFAAETRVRHLLHEGAGR
jgi:NitT/TauT family transport system ATP-binding protein